MVKHSALIIFVAFFLLEALSDDSKKAPMAFFILFIEMFLDLNIPSESSVCLSRSGELDWESSPFFGS